MNPIEIISPEFIILTGVALIGYHILRGRYRNIWVLGISYFFYATWGWQYLLILQILTLINYGFGLLLAKFHSQWLLLTFISFNALLFLVLKALVGPYGLNFLTKLLDKTQATHLTAILLPIGFSFYILQIVSYLVDVYRGQISAETDLVAFAAYMAYFPKMLAGPIERAKTFIPQWKQSKKMTVQMVDEGIYLILVGLLRKVVIADHLTRLFPGDVFISPEMHTVIERGLWITIFAFILYNDFAGYTAIIRGVSLFFGIRLSSNFRQPMFASSFSDFWTRWHISLSEWLRDYIFFPIRRWLSRQHTPKWLILTVPPLTTMLVSGYWHGAYFSILFWGLLHGIYLVGEQVLQQHLFPPKKRRASLYLILVLSLTTVAWIPFGTPGLGAAQRFLFASSTQKIAGLALYNVVDLTALASLSLWLDYQQEKTHDTAFPRHWSTNQQTIGIALIILTILVFSSTGNDLSGFIYQGY